MSQALYRPFGQSSLSQKTFTFGLGKLPYFENGKLYQYEFVSVPPDENSFAAATSTASAPQESACGMRSYLATIQSRLEQDHLVKAMETGPAAGVRSGWIGARVNGASEISWVTDPVIQKNFTFWQGDGVDGQPYNAVTNIPVIPNARNLISHDHLPLEDGHRKQTLVQHADITKKVHFTNWAGGNDSINCSSVDGTHVTTRRPFCQPVELGDGYGVAVNGHQQRKGTWVTSPDSGRQCDENQNHSICGFYREYDTGGEASSNSLAEQVTVDMSRLREFCLGD